MEKCELWSKTNCGAKTHLALISADLQDKLIAIQSSVTNQGNI